MSRSQTVNVELGIPLADGDVPIWNAATSTWLHGAAFSAAAFASGATPYFTVLDQHYDLLPNQTLSPDGPYTIGGVVGVQKENSVNDAVAMAIFNGSGLRIRPSGGTYFGPTRTAPLLWYPFSSFMPASFEWASAVRILCEIAADNATLNGALTLAVDSNDLRFAYQSNRYFDGVHEINACSIYTGGSQKVSTNTQIPVGAASFVLELSVPALWCSDVSMSGLYAPAPMPAIGNMQAMRPHTGTGLAAGITQIANGDDVGPLLTQMGIVIAAEAAGEDITIKRLRVDVRL